MTFYQPAGNEVELFTRCRQRPAGTDQRPYRLW